MFHICLTFMTGPQFKVLVDRHRVVTSRKKLPTGSDRTVTSRSSRPNYQTRHHVGVCLCVTDRLLWGAARPCNVVDITYVLPLALYVVNHNNKLAVAQDLLDLIKDTKYPQ